MSNIPLHEESPFLAKIREAEENKGRFHRIETVRDCKTLKTYDGPRIRKRVVFQGRVGHDYANQAAVMEKHESGERAKVGLPDWCEYVSPAIRAHKGTGRHYLAFQPMGNVPQVSFECGGKVVTKDEVAAFLLASEKKESEERPDWLTVGLDTVTGFD